MGVCNYFDKMHLYPA